MLQEVSKYFLVCVSISQLTTDSLCDLVWYVTVYEVVCDCLCWSNCVSSLSALMPVCVYVTLYLQLCGHVCMHMIWREFVSVGQT